MKINSMYSCLFIFLTNYGYTQVVDMDTIFRPRNFSIRIEQFKNYPNATDDIIFLGNSLTAYTDWNELLGLKNVRNRGISGDTTFGILERLDEVTEGKPAKIFILIGINDISRNVPAEMILKNYKKILIKINSESPNTHVYAQTLLPVNKAFARYVNHYNKDEQIAEVNNGIKRLEKKENFTVIDLHPHFIDKENRLNKKFTEEGLHLNAEGYELWAKILIPFLN